MRRLRAETRRAEIETTRGPFGGLPDALKFDDEKGTMRWRFAAPGLKQTLLTRPLGKLLPILRRTSSNALRDTSLCCSYLSIVHTPRARRCTSSALSSARDEAVICAVAELPGAGAPATVDPGRIFPRFLTLPRCARAVRRPSFPPVHPIHPSRMNALSRSTRLELRWAEFRAPLQPRSAERSFASHRHDVKLPPILALKPVTSWGRAGRAAKIHAARPGSPASDRISPEPSFPRSAFPVRYRWTSSTTSSIDTTMMPFIAGPSSRSRAQP